MNNINPAKIYIKRILENKINRYFKTPEVIAIVGARQCGKTTLLKKIYTNLKKAVYLDFEDREVLNLFNEDIKAFYNLYLKDCQFLFIDEFQYAQEGGKKLKYLYDNYKIKIFISGSSTLDLTFQAVKHLVGRIFTFELYPFNFSEYLSYKDLNLFSNIYVPFKKSLNKFLLNQQKTLPKISSVIIKKINNYYQEFVLFGGYPRVVLAKDNEEKKLVLKNIYNTYLLKEIRDILNLSTDYKLEKLIKALSLQIGNLINYNELSQITSLKYKDLLRHLTILEKTFICERIMPFYSNKRLEIAKSPKIYFFDNGFRNLVINNFQNLHQRTDKGFLNENFVATQLIKNGISLNYWRTKSQAEIDFVINIEGKKYAYEVKSNLKANKIGKAVHSFKNKYPVEKIIITNNDFYFFDKKYKVVYLPLVLV